MNLRTNRKAWAMLAFAGLLVALGIAYSQEQGKTSYTKLYSNSGVRVGFVIC
jgi:hypothetical protein